MSDDIATTADVEANNILQKALNDGTIRMESKRSRTHGFMAFKFPCTDPEVVKAMHDIVKETAKQSQFIQGPHGEPLTFVPTFTTRDLRRRDQKSERSVTMRVISTTSFEPWKAPDVRRDRDAC